MKILALIFALIFPVALYAADATVDWQHPTNNVDGSPIPATGPAALSSTRLEYGTCSGTAFGQAEGSVSAPYPATSAIVPGLEYGRSYCFRGASVNNAGEVSAWSNVVSRFILVPAPNPPTLSATVNVVWELRGQMNTTIAGFTDIGAPCEKGQFTTKDGLTFNSIDPKYVTLIKNREPKNLVTICQPLG